MLKKVVIFVLLGIFLVSGAVWADNQNQNQNQNNNAANNKAVDLQCMQNAIEKRDNAIITAWGKYTTGIKTALETRRDALKAAFALTDKKQRKEAIKKVWKDYSKAIKAARKTFRSEKKAVWKQYYTERKACRGNGEDKTGEGADGDL